MVVRRNDSTRTVLPSLALDSGTPCRNDAVGVGRLHHLEFSHYHFMLTEPVGGRRKVGVYATKTARDLAAEVKMLLNVDHPDADQVVLVWDNLNTHTPVSLYKAFPSAEARRLLDRLEIRYTPKHGSRSDIAEIELSVFTKSVQMRLSGS